MADSPFRSLPWDAGRRRVTLEDRLWLRSVSDAEADEIHAYVTGPAAIDPEMADEIDRLRDLLEGRAVARAEERVWQSLSPDERARLLEIAGERGTAPTEEMARGLIDSQLLFLGGRPATMSRQTLFGVFGFDPPAMLAAGELLAQPGEMRRRFPLEPRKKKRFGIF